MNSEINQYYQSIFSRMPDVVIVFRKSEEKEIVFEYVNPAGEKLLKINLEDLKNQSLSDNTFFSSAKTFITHINKCFEHNTAEQFELELADNAYFDITLSPIENVTDTNKLTLCILKDISEKKAKEHKLSETQYMFEQFLEFSPVYVFFKDEHIRAIALSKNYEKMLNMPLEDILGKTMDELFPSPLAKSMIEDDKKILSEREPFEVNEELDGRYYYTVKFPIRRNENSPLMLAGFTMDITDFVVTEKALRESEERFKTTFLISPDAININRLSDGVYVDINEGFTKITDWTREDVIGKSSLELNIWLNPADREKLVKGLMKKGYYENLEAEFMFKNGKVRTGLMSARIIQFGNEQCILSITRDISERKATERLLVEKNEEYKTINEELTKAKEKAEQSDKLKSAFLANMSHEIRTPLNAIMGFSELLEDPEIETDNISEYTNVIRQRGEDLLNLINDILDLSKIESDQLNICESNVDLINLFNELNQVSNLELTHHAHKNIRLKQIIPDNNNWQIIADENRLRQILTNLLNNAIKYTNEGYIEYGFNVNQNEITFFVKDTGIGIPDDKKDLVFERFHQLGDTDPNKRSAGGAGLGLSICKGLVELMNGKIWFESEYGKGSIFKFTLPYLKGSGEEKPRNEEDPSSNEYPDKCILIVEDDFYNAEYLVQALENVNTKYILVNDGASALKILNSDQGIDLALIDILLPDVSGFDIIRKIRELRPNTPIIAQTAYASPQDERKCYDAGAHGFLSKPIALQKLYDILAKFL